MLEIAEAVANRPARVSDFSEVCLFCFCFLKYPEETTTTIFLGGSFIKQLWEIEKVLLDMDLVMA